MPSLAEMPSYGPVLLRWTDWPGEARRHGHGTHCWRHTFAARERGTVAFCSSYALRCPRHACFSKPIWPTQVFCQAEVTLGSFPVRRISTSPLQSSLPSHPTVPCSWHGGTSESLLRIPRGHELLVPDIIVRIGQLGLAIHHFSPHSPPGRLECLTAPPSRVVVKAPSPPISQSRLQSLSPSLSPDIRLKG